MKKHQKHTNLIRRNNDNFAPNEIAILGTKCNSIADLVHQISDKLLGYKLAYFDASHSNNNSQNKISEFTFHHKGNLQISTLGNVNKFQQRLQFAQYDYVFINGNHYQGVKQILILDEEKETSILKRIHQLKNIQFIIKLTKNTDFFPFLEEKYPHIKNITTYTIDEIEKIANHINNLIQEKIAPVKGLVLVGGKSIRMGTDKSLLNYYGKPQKEVAKELLESNNLETFYSVQPFDKVPVDQRQNSYKENEIYDTFLNLGPFGGICSAFQQDPNTAFLVLATDLPFVNKKLIYKLLSKRNPSKVATAIKGKNKEFLEPLVTIYEPKAYPVLLQYLAQGYSCPRKMLINSDVEIVEVEDDFIRNVNTPQEFEEVKKKDIETSSKGY